MSDAIGLTIIAFAIVGLVSMCLAMRKACCALGPVLLARLQGKGEAMPPPKDNSVM